MRTTPMAPSNKFQIFFVLEIEIELLQAIVLNALRHYVFLHLQVFKEYGCMLNQTNIGANNNKFYVINLLANGTRFTLCTRWGRVVST